MVSTSTKFALNKRTLSRKSVSTRRNKAFDEKSISASRKKRFPLLGIEKMEENWCTPNFKNCVHQQKRAPNKGIKFVINRKSVSTSQNEGFLEKCDFTGLKSYSHSNQYLKKIEENGFF